MSASNNLAHAYPVAPLRIIPLPGCEAMAASINKHLLRYRKELLEENPSKAGHYAYDCDNYILPCSCPRFGSGEAKGVVLESVRGLDLFLLVDICNYSVTYRQFGYTNHMSPDDHYQNLKRIIAAVNGKAHRINVIMPFLYEGRQHKRTGRESLDCSMALRELSSMGVKNFITFDAHDPRVQNAIPLRGFDNFFPTYQFLLALLKAEPDLQLNNEHLMVISPDEGAMSRAVYFSNVLGVDMGMFYKRRDYSVIVDGKNPIVAHEFLGDSVKGKDCVVIDDMISSGGSMLDVATQLKDRGARNVFVCATYGLFTDGLATFDKYYKDGIIKKIITTNLIYQNPKLKTKNWYASAKMEKYVSAIIDTINHDVSIQYIYDNTIKIHKLLQKHR